MVSDTLLNSVLMVGIDDKQYVICKQIDVAMFQQTFIDQKQLRPIGHSLPIPCLRLMALREYLKQNIPTD